MMKMTQLRNLLLGASVLVGIDKSDATFDKRGASLRGKARKHNGRKLVSEDANLGEFPFFTQWGGCGATLIWGDILLTSASCDEVKSKTVLVGAHRSNEEQGGSVKRKIVSRHIHPEYNQENLLNNFMILKLNETVDVQTALINATIEIPTDPELYGVGFGFTPSLVHVNEIYSRSFHHSVLDTSELLQSGNDQGSVLQKAKMKIIPHAECNAYDQYAGFIDDGSMICVSDDDATCLGDNGGPLCAMIDNKCLQIGIVSFGDSCSTRLRPTVYSSISAAYGWIEKIICHVSSKPPSSCQTVVKIREPYPGLSESFTSRSAHKNSKELPLPSTHLESKVPTDYQSFIPSSKPSPVSSLMPSDGPSLAPSEKPSFHNNKPSSVDQDNRSLRKQAIRYKMPRYPRTDLDVTVRKEPDGIHLFFWRFGSPHSKLGLCEGDCNSDDDCDEGLYCYHKDPSVTSVPGCVGTDTSRTDFCTIKSDQNSSVHDESSRIDETAKLPVLSLKKLGQCEGDCNSDEDCAEGLYCFMRDGNVESVPGCSGVDNSRTDFCTIKTVSGTNTSTNGPRISNQVLIGDGAMPMLFVYPENPPDISNLPLLACQGDCDNDSDCADGLICYSRNGKETTVPGCSGESTTRTDFCVDPAYIMSPTFEPSRKASGPPAETAGRSEIEPLEPTPSPSRTWNAIDDLFANAAATQPPTLTPTSIPTQFIEETLAPTIPSPSPSLIPTSTIASPSQSQSSVSITVAIFFDPWPEEVSWKIESEEGDLITAVTAGSYTSTIDQTFELVTVKPGKMYRFTIADAGNDGIAGIGNLYEIVMTENPDIMLLDGDGVFENGRTKMFYVPNTEEYPTSAPTEPTISPAPTFNTVNVYLTIVFDNWHQETSWEITAADDPTVVFAEAAYDTYRGGEKITNEIPLPPGQEYTFTINDFFEDGIKDGEYLLKSADGIILFEGNGDFGASRNHTFTVPENP